MVFFMWTQGASKLRNQILGGQDGLKIIDLHGGKIHDPLSRKHHSLLFLPCLSRGPLNGFLSWHSYLQGPSSRCVSCCRNSRDIRGRQVCRAEEIPSRTDANHYYVSVENALVFIEQKLMGQCPLTHTPSPRLPRPCADLWIPDIVLQQLHTRQSLSPFFVL